MVQFMAFQRAVHDLPTEQQQPEGLVGLQRTDQLQLL